MDPVEPFATLPFEEQVVRIEAAARGGGDAVPLLREAGGLPDAEPLTRLLGALVSAGAVDERVTEAAAAIFAALPDAALLHLISTSDRPPQLDAFLADLVEGALSTWPLARISALAVLSRWLRRYAPARWERLEARARGELAGDAPAERWLLFATGPELAERSRDPARAAAVRGVLAETLDALARAPKSISQAHAEQLLARRVYADAGHFLFELLQNADDALATRWRVAIAADRVVTTHDGVPLSLHDVVGLLSIGQTTKRAEQIGFFGVGFKSVYEVCARPRVHSGAFDFEIAHISIPRAIARRPPAADDGDTVFVLPFDRGGDGRVDPEVIHRRALAIPPETLLTLPHLASLEVIGPSGQGRRWVDAASPSGDGRVLSRIDGDALVEARPYLVVEDTMRFEGPREEGRPRESVVLVAVALDAQGAPAPTSGSTLFAFLPTAVHTGLRVLVHARFDVTLDRERLAQGSAWNDALLAHAGRGLARAVERLVGTGRCPLGVLPAPGELTPVAAPIGAAAAASLAEVPCLRGQAGELLPPSQGRLAEPALASALAGLDLGAGARALAPLDERARRVAAGLGAAPFGPAELVGFLAGALRPGAHPPPWLAGPVLECLAAAPGDDAALRALPILLDGRGDLVAAAEARSAAAPWPEVYAGVRPLVSDAALASLPPGLLRRLRLPRHGESEVVVDLRDPAMRAVLVGRPSLLDALMTLGDGALDALADVPLIRDAGGGLRAVTAGLRRLARPLGPLHDLLADRVPLVDPGVAAKAAPLVTRWVRAFGLADLAELATRAGWRGAEAERVARILDAEVEVMSAGLARRLAEAPLFADRAGERRPLLGPGRALTPAAPELTDLLPGWPWLADPGRPFPRAVAPPAVGAVEVCRALAEGTEGIDDAALVRVLPWLADRAGVLPAADAERLLEARVWPDASARRAHLSELRRGEGPEHVRAFYEATGLRRVAHPVTEALIEALRGAERLASATLATVAGDLYDLGGEVRLPRGELARLLNLAAVQLPQADLERLRELPIFCAEPGGGADEGGGPLGCWSAPQPAARHRAGSLRAVLRRGSSPLLSEADEALFEPFLAAAGPAPATLADALRQARRDPAVAAAAPELREAVLASEAAALDEEARAALAALPILRDATGRARPIRELSPATLLVEHLGAERVARLALDGALLHPDDEATAARLGLPVRGLDALLRGDVLPTLEVGAPLDAQPPPWGSPPDLAHLLGLCAAAGLAVEGLPLGVDDRGVVRPTPLAWAPADARALIASLDLAGPLADPAWVEALPRAVRDDALRPTSARQIAEALRQACPEELPREGHPILSDPDPLFAWLLDAAVELEEDEAARGALGGAAVLPSERGTLRAPRELVLDPDAPDLGLGWGLAPDVPRDVARALLALYPFDRRQRRVVITHVLDGLTAARDAGDGARAAALIAFLARAVGASELPAEELAERVRYNGIRARLEVPLAEGGFGKARRAWLATADEAAGVASFCADPPAIVELAAGDEAVRALLVACGADVELDDALIVACLDGSRRRPGAAATLSLARHVAAAAVADPERATRWGLARRAWAPDGEGRARLPRELLWPDPLALALFGDDPARFPDPALTRDLPEAAPRVLGFARADALGPGDLADLAARSGARAATPALLDWLEEGLAGGRFTPGAIRGAFRDRLRLADREGVPRRVRELALEGARELFGPWRGDLADPESIPRLAHALGIVERPDEAMILSFLADVGRGLDGPVDAADRALGEVLARCYERLVDAVAAGQRLRLPADAPVPGLRGAAPVVARVSDPAVRLLDPPELAEALPDDALAGWIDPAPTCPRGDALRDLLFEAGVVDLWVGFAAREVARGPRVEALEAEAERAREALARALGTARTGGSARVAEPLSLVGELAGSPARVPVDAAVVDGILWLTPEALAAPELLAVALEPVPARRAAMRRWLAEGAWSAAPAASPGGARRPAAEPASGPGRGVLSRLRRWVARRAARSEGAEGGPRGRPSEAESRARDAELEATRSPVRSPRVPRPGAAGGGGGSSRPPPPDAEGRPWRMRYETPFAPQDEVREQLEGGSDWMARRLTRPEVGFAFTPATLPSPWVYAPNLIATRFDRRGQRWAAARLERPLAGRPAGSLIMRGKLDPGDAVLPVPMAAELESVRVEGEVAATLAGPAGERVLRLREAARVDLRVKLGTLEGLEQAAAVDDAIALASFVPDEELPAEALAFVDALDEEASPLARALAVRDFVRARYRYDPSYLEDPGLGRWLARVTQGRANVHVAALHVGAGGEHLGAGVCYELNTLACELMRRAGVPCAIATGWVLTGGSLSDPDHLWAVALLRDPSGAPVWVPVDASSTRDGRPLTVARRPSVRVSPPRDRRASAPKPPRELGGGGGRGPTGGGRGGGGSRGPRGPRGRDKPPRKELIRLLHHLEVLAGTSLPEGGREALEHALSDPAAARALLRRLERGLLG